MAAEADDQLHPAAVNDILQGFFEMNYDYFLKGRIFRLTSPNTGAALPRGSILYNFDELVWIEAIYGGRIDLDAMLLSEASDDHILSRRMKPGFNLLYGISYAHYRDIFQDVPEDVIDTLNKRSNVLIGLLTIYGFCTSACPHD
ncbi:hypothetical protein DPV78_003750 [Talaromyces pinophilus]|nr:hypothetical protein DPV78_003750 [Talaromyces pinophilus]